MHSSNWTLEVGDLFSVLGMKTRGLVEMNENTYDFDPSNPKDSWLYPVFLGFQALQHSGFKADSFATIGTGSGIDSIGAYELFGPKLIYQVDVHPNVPEVADRNAKKLIGHGAKIETFLGDLCTPLIERGIKVDLAYANIPNLPSAASVLDKKVSASQFKERDAGGCPAKFQQWLLTLQHLFLEEAKGILNPGGVVVDAIGSRVPQELLEELFTVNGYASEELASVYKIQSEPEDTLELYALYEKDGVDFDFYDHERAWPYWQKNLEGKGFRTPEIKDALRPFRVTAADAYRAWREKSRQAGHICSILKGTVRS